MSAEPNYQIVILCGHPGSGKTALAHAIAEKIGEKAMIMSIQVYVKNQFANIIETDVKNFEHPYAANVAYGDREEDDPNAATCFGEAYDLYYQGVRVCQPWYIWVMKLQGEIFRQLLKPEGKRFFIVDDISYADECDFLMNYVNCTGVTIFLDGNPGKKFPVDGNRTSYVMRENILANAKKRKNFYFVLDTKRNKTEPVLDSIKRCVNKVQVCLGLAVTQKQLLEEKKRAEEENRKKEQSATT